MIPNGNYLKLLSYFKQMRQHNVWDKIPNGNYLKLLSYFKKMRQHNVWDKIKKDI